MTAEKTAPTLVQEPGLVRIFFLECCDCTLLTMI